MRLKRLIMVTRHGDRTPLVGEGGNDDSTQRRWSTLVDADQCSVLPPELQAAFGPAYPGMLTFGGHRQLVALGEALHLVYGPRLGLRHVRVESTDYPRTFLSARALLEGLLPGQSVAISIRRLPTAAKPIPSKMASEGDTMHGNITLTRPPAQPESSFFATSTGCSRLREMLRDLQERPIYRELRRELDKLMSATSGNLSFGEVNDDLLCRACHNFALPRSLRPHLSSSSPSQVASSLCALNRRIHRWESEVSNEHPKLVQLQVGYILGQLLSFLDADSKLINNETRTLVDSADTTETKSTFYMLSAHDTTLTQLLAALGAGINDWPPYAAHLIVELWESGMSQSLARRSLHSRILYNGRVVRLPWCGEGQTCPWGKLIEYTKGVVLHTDEDYIKACDREG